MREFFRPFRRKLGVLVLVLACVFAGMWIRSTMFYDVISFGNTPRQQAIFSIGGRLTYWMYTLHSPDTPYRQVQSARFESADLPARLESIATTRELLTATDNLVEFWLPYWAIVSPLTLLSAWLLIGKPRRKPVIVSARNFRVLSGLCF